MKNFFLYTNASYELAYDFLPATMQTPLKCKTFIGFIDFKFLINYYFNN